MRSGAKKQGGAMMIEILVTLAITVIGMYGIIEVHSKLQKSEMDSYQRTQALLLLEDMANRMETNRSDESGYLTTSSSPAYVGAGQGCPASDGSIAENDLLAWCESLKGASETLAGNDVGTILGGRGCIEEVGAGSGQYMITITWQGLSPVAAPPNSVSCAADLYNKPVGSDCVDDLCRRYVTTMVKVAAL